MQDQGTAARERKISPHDVAVVSGWFGRGWRTFRARPWPLVGGFAFLVVAFALVTLAGTLTDVEWLALVLAAFVGPPIIVGWALLALRIVRGERATPLAVLGGFRRPALAIAGIVGYLALIAGGLVLAVVPGLVAMTSLSMTAFAVADRGMSAGDAFRFSRKITRGFRWPILGFLLLSILLTLAGLLTLGTGFIVIGPWLMSAWAVAYTDLVAKETSE